MFQPASEKADSPFYYPTKLSSSIRHDIHINSKTRCREKKIDSYYYWTNDSEIYRVEQNKWRQVRGIAVGLPVIG